ncbi:MAG TPA: hypothetical protein VJ770_04515 [Stellaceae bacterium]|nr:hypothetical protein [Stellaceae bacterium]
MANEQITITFGASLGELIEAVAQAKAAIAAIREPIDGLISGFRELGEAIRTAFAGGEIAKTAKRATGLGESGRGGADKRKAEQAIRKEAELFAAGERLKLAEAKGDADKVAAIYDEWLSEVAAIYGQASVQYLNLERETVAVARRASEQRIRILDEEYRRALAIGIRETEGENRARAAAAREAAEQTQRAYQRFAGPVEHAIGDALTDAVLGIRERGGLRAVMLGIEKSAVGGVMNNLVNGIGDSLLKPLFTSLFPQGSILGGLFGIGQDATKVSLLTLIATNTGIIAGNTAATAAATATSGVAGGIGGVFSAIGSIPVVGKIGSFFANIFTQGGIVPSAMGGWSLPDFAGGMPALLHSREMVLPADISQGLQNMIRGGGPNGAGGDVHVHLGFYGPSDGASVARWFGQNRADIAAAVRSAWDAGALPLT